MTEELKVIISAEVSKFKQGMESATKDIKGFKQQIEEAKGHVDKNISKMGDGIKKGMKVATTAIAAAGTACFAFTKKVADTADNIDKMSQRLGLSRQGFQELDYVLSQSGVDVNSFQTGMKSLLKNMDGVTEGNKTAIDNFNKLGVSVTDASGKMRNQEEVLKDVITAFQGMEDGAEKSRLAQELFGKQGQEILPLLNSEAGSFEKLVNQAHEYGLILDDEVVDAGVNFTDTLDSAKRAAGALGVSIGGKLMPIITDMLNKFIEHLPEIQEKIESVVNGIGKAINFVQQHIGLLKTIAVIFGTVTTAIGLYNAVAAVKAAMDAAEVATLGALIAAKIADAAATMLALAPYIAIVAAITAVIAIIVLCVKHWDEIKEVVIKVWDKIKSTVQAGVDAVVGFFEKVINWIKENWQGLLLILVNPIAGAFKLVYDNCEGFRNKVDAFVGKVKEIFSTGFNAAKNTVVNIFTSIKDKISNILEGAKNTVKNVIDKIRSFFKFEWSLPKLKMPHVKISGSFSLAPPSVPKFSIDWYAKGGVFDTPTLFGYGSAIGGLGEAGAEAVVPLEKNTGWMDKIAERIGNKIGNTPVVLQIDGKTFATTSISCINDYTRQTGHLALNII